MKHLLFITSLFLAAYAFPLVSSRAADPEKPSGYTLQCDMVPVKDVIVQKGAGFKIVGSDPWAMVAFELHALIAWSTLSWMKPALSSCFRDPS